MSSPDARPASNAQIVSLSDYRQADAARRQILAKAVDPAFTQGASPGKDYHRLGKDLAIAARLVRGGIAPAEGTASFIDRLSVNARLASIEVRELEDRAARAERRLKKARKKAKKHG